MRSLALLPVFAVVALGYLPSAAAADAGALICQESPCTTDADCGAGMRCQQGAATECLVMADGGQSCAPATLCEPMWNVSCSQDSDCGDGFACVGMGQSCDCSASPTNVPGDAVSTPCSAIPQPPGPLPLCPPDAGVCSIAPSICNAGGTCLCWTPKQCQQKATGACSTSSDCPPLFTCSSGSCQPPCSNLRVYAGGVATSIGTSVGTGTGTLPTSPGTTGAASASASEGGCTASGASPGAGWAWLVALCVGLAVRVSARRRG